tara:strand:+ start:9 stop:422 length:414 start_codon:yes stop_codon:yes gene_type:complete
MFKLCGSTRVQKNSKKKKKKKKKDLCLNNIMENEDKLFKKKSKNKTKIIGAKKEIQNIKCEKIVKSNEILSSELTDANSVTSNDKTSEKTKRKKKFDNLFLNIPEHKVKMKRRYVDFDYYGFNKSPRIEHYETIIYK